MGSTSNPSTGPETYPTTAEVGAFIPWLLSGRYSLHLNNQKVK